MSLTEVIECTIDTNGGEVVVNLHANNALLTGSEFAVWAADGTTKREEWNLSAGTSGAGSHHIASAVASLDGNYLTWEITVCSAHPAIASGAVEVTVTQDGVSCSLTKPLRWSLEDVPLCESGEVDSIKRRLKFRRRTPGMGEL